MKFNSNKQTVEKHPNENECVAINLLFSCCLQDILFNIQLILYLLTINKNNVFSYLLIMFINSC